MNQTVGQLIHGLKLVSDAITKASSDTKNAADSDAKAAATEASFSIDNMKDGNPDALVALISKKVQNVKGDEFLAFFQGIVKARCTVIQNFLSGAFSPFPSNGVLRDTVFIREKDVRVRILRDKSTGQINFDVKALNAAFKTPPTDKELQTIKQSFLVLLSFYYVNAHEIEVEYSDEEFNITFVPWFETANPGGKRKFGCVPAKMENKKKQKL
jgi:hypothetical protein